MLPRIAALLCLATSLFPAALQAQSKDLSSPPISYWSRKNTFGIFGEYSNDSSRILLGEAANRKLLNFGISYNHRLLLRRYLDMQYMAELRPVMLESDPVVREVTHYTGPLGYNIFTNDFRQSQPCRPQVITFNGMSMGGPYTTTNTYTCGRRQWTFGQGLSPAGLKLSLLPQHRIQPLFTLLGGYMLSTNPVPMQPAGSFNYTLEVGAGIELFHSRDSASKRFANRSLRAEYRYHHISNTESARFNPGIDNGLFQVTFAFGR